MFIFFWIFITNITNWYNLSQKDKDKIEIVVNKYMNDENNKKIILKKLQKLQPKLKIDTREYEIVSLLIKSLNKKITLEDFYAYRDKYDQIVEVKWNTAIVMKYVSWIKQYWIIDLKWNEISPIWTSWINWDKIIQIKIKNPNPEECVDLSSLFWETPKNDNDCMIVYNKATEIVKISDNLYSFLDTNNQKYWFANSSWNIIQEAIYDDINYYSLYQWKYIIAQKNGLLWLLDLQLNIIVDFKYADIQTTWSLNNKLVVKNDKLYIWLIDIANSWKEILPIKYLDMSVYNNFIVVWEKKDNGFWYSDIFKVLDNNLKEIARYDRVFESDWVIFLEKNKKVWIMNKDGKIIIPVNYSYDNIISRHGNFWLIFLKKSNSFKIYNLNGNILYEDGNISISNVYENTENWEIFIVLIDNFGKSWIVSLYANKKIIPNKYLNISFDWNYFITKSESWESIFDLSWNNLTGSNYYEYINYLWDWFFQVQKNYKLWVIDSKNNIIYPIISSSSINYLWNNIFLVNKDWYFWIINSENSIIVPFEYKSVLFDNNSYSALAENKDWKKWYLYNDWFFKVIWE